MKNVRTTTSKGVRRDISLMLQSMKLYSLRRYHKHRFWEVETRESDYAARIESFPRLESVAEHSWHVADAVMLLGANFPSLDRERCLRMAILHDKTEIYTGDYKPAGRDGTGLSTYAFDEGEHLNRQVSDEEAINRYLRRLPPLVREEQAKDLLELSDGMTPEARFVKAADKLQALAYVLVKKKGVFDDRHLEFTLRYSHKVVEYYPGLTKHYEELRSRVLAQVARQRKTSIRALQEKFESKQCPLL